MTSEPVTREEDARHWQHWRRNAVIGYVVLALGFGVGGYVQNQAALHARAETNVAAKEFCVRLNSTAGVMAAALAQQKKLSQAKYEQGLTKKSEWIQQQAALDKAIKGLAPSDCSVPAVT